MVDLEKKQKSYSLVFGIVGLVYIFYWIVYYIEKCNPLMFLAFVMVLCFIVLTALARKADYFFDLFTVCGVGVVLSVLISQLLLGPNFGFQYYYYGLIPVVFYVAFDIKKDIGISIKAALGTSVLLVLTSIANLLIPYPLYQIRPAFVNVITIFNEIVSFFSAVCFMAMFVNRVLLATGSLSNQKKNIEESANIDPLTGLRNRRSLDKYLEFVVRDAFIERNDYTVLMCDVDNFKNVNDTYGHECGDLVLKNIASIIKAETREDDVIFRWGGEEILIVVSGGKYIASKIAERCRESIENSEVDFNGTKVKVTITIGGASYYQGLTKEELVNKADKNLYDGKQNGKNQVVM